MSYLQGLRLVGCGLLVLIIGLTGCQHLLPSISPTALADNQVMQIRYQEIVQATQAFYATLTPQQQINLQQPFEHPYRTRGFCYVLAHCKTEYVGLRMRDLQIKQKYALNQLLMKVLSGEGYARAIQTMNREWLLQEMENAHRADPKQYPVVGSAQVPQWTPPLLRGAEDYYVAIFGKPGAPTGWGIRFEGHHLTVNSTYGENNGQVQVSVLPMFFGASPMLVPKAPEPASRYPHWHAQQGQQSLQREAWLARSFLRTLTQPQTAISQWRQLPAAELAGGTDMPLQAEHYLHNQRPGQPVAQLTATQQALLWDFMQSFLLTQNPHAVPWDLLKQDLQHARIWWFGDIQDEQAELYLRVQSSRYLVELLQANSFGVISDVKANHVHASFRDLTSDWDFNVLGEHLKNQHQH